MIITFFCHLLNPVQPAFLIHLDNGADRVLNLKDAVYKEHEIRFKSANVDFTGLTFYALPRALSEKPFKTLARRAVDRDVWNTDHLVSEGELLSEHPEWQVRGNVGLFLRVQTREELHKRKHDLVDVPVDAYEQLKRAKIVGTSPSRVASPSMFKSMQDNPDERILDDRPHPDEDIPPIALLYHGFGHFLDICRGKTGVPGLDKVDQRRLKKNVDKLAQRMCFYYENGEVRRDEGLRSIYDIFQSRSDTQIPGFSEDIGTYRSDGHVMGDHGGAVIVLEFRNGITGITSIPVVEATASAAQTHKIYMELFAAVFRGWRVPCLGLTVVGKLEPSQSLTYRKADVRDPSGCHVTFYAIVAIHHQYRVIPLTSTLSCLPDANDGNDRESLYLAFMATSVLLACILEDGARYVMFPPPEVPVGCHQYPAVTRLLRHKSEGFVNFQIKYFHPDRQPYRWLYIAETEDGEQILVKFTRHYSADLHDFCASSDRSPKILGFEKLAGGWCGIAMQYFPSASPLLRAKGLQDHGYRWIAELRGLVDSFHKEGFVHGDLRDPNIICDGQQLLLIGFDWAGKAGEVSYPLDLDDLNPELLKGRSSTDATITVDDDNRILEATLDKIRSKLVVSSGDQHSDSAP